MKFIAILLLIAGMSATAQQQIIDTGTPNSGTGDSAYVAFGKVNNNFTELFNGAGGFPQIAGYSIVCNNQAIQATPAACGALPATVTVTATQITSGTLACARLPTFTGEISVTGCAATVTGLNGAVVPASAALTATNVSGQLTPITLGTGLSITGGTLNASIVPPTGNVINVQQAGAVCDNGVTDNATFFGTTLPNLVAAAPAGVTVYFPPSPPCLTSQPMVFNSNATYWAYPHSVTIGPTTSTINYASPMLGYGNGISNLTIHGLTFDGGQPAYPLPGAALPGNGYGYGSQVQYATCGVPYLKTNAPASIGATSLSFSSLQPQPSALVAGASAGQMVAAVGGGIPANTTVLSTSGTTVILSNPTTTSIANGTPIFFGVNSAQYPYGATGTATGGSMTTIVDTTQTWTVNQFQNFPGVVTVGGTAYSFKVLSNTATTITFTTAIAATVVNSDAYTVSATTTLGPGAVCTNALILRSTSNVTIEDTTFQNIGGQAMYLANPVGPFTIQRNSLNNIGNNWVNSIQNGTAGDAVVAGYDRFSGFLLLCNKGQVYCSPYNQNYGVQTTGSFTTISSPNNGSYVGVPLTGGSGSGAIATIGVTGHNVNTVTITTAGSLYNIGDVLSFALTNGSGTATVTSLSTQTNSVFRDNTMSTVGLSPLYWNGISYGLIENNTCESVQEAIQYQKWGSVIQVGTRNSNLPACYAINSSVGINVVGNYADWATGQGIDIDHDTPNKGIYASDINVVGNTIRYSGGAGINFEGNNSVITGNSTISNNQAVATSLPFIGGISLNLGTTNANNLVISGNLSTDEQTNKTQQYGLYQYPPSPSTFGITGITQATSATFTIGALGGVQPLLIGQSVTFTGVNGMTQINGLTGVISAVGGSQGAWTGTVNINSSGFSPWTSGGSVSPQFLLSNAVISGNDFAGNFVANISPNLANLNTLTGSGVAPSLTTGSGNNISGTGGACDVPSGTTSNMLELCAGGGSLIQTTGGNTPSTSLTTVAGSLAATGGYVHGRTVLCQSGAVSTSYQTTNVQTTVNLAACTVPAGVMVAGAKLVIEVSWLSAATATAKTAAISYGVTAGTPGQTFSGGNSYMSASLTASDSAARSLTEIVEAASPANTQFASGSLNGFTPYSAGVASPPSSSVTVSNPSYVNINCLDGSTSGVGEYCGINGYTVELVLP